jgi:serine/threonine-protein phosphatase 2B catalytic subunit
MENNQQDVDQQSYMDNAIRAVQQKKPVPEIDFTLHTMEDGTQVSTQERVCKGMRTSRALQALQLAAAVRVEKWVAT